MRKNLHRLAQRMLAPFRPDERFETQFDDVAQMVHAARAFRGHGCQVRLGRPSLSLVVTLPRANAGTNRLAPQGSVR